MGSLIYIRLIGHTFGTLLLLFWMVAIVGYRRQRNFERVFVSLCVALFLFYSGSLLALNSHLYYPQPPAALNEFAIGIITLGLCLLPAVLLHLHVEYAETRGLLRSKRWKLAVLLVFYAACVHLAVQRIPLLYQDPHFDFLVPGRSLGQGFAIVLATALAWSAGWEARFAAAAPDKPQRYFHWTLLAFFVLSSLAVAALHFPPIPVEARTAEAVATAFSFLPILPFTVLIYLVQRHNFLQIGRQKNLLYAISATFLALLYLSLVRRLGTWLEPVLPPEATAAILLFILVIFIEPLQRALGRRLQETAMKEMELAHRLSAEINGEARRGDVLQLASFIESRLKEQFELAEVGLMLWDPLTGKEERVPARKVFKQGFAILQGNRTIGTLSVEPHGAAISGETKVALEFLCDQLPGALDLCRLIEEKLRLERELAERERLALVGQMAASISHNLKNPLGSMKTILQVQMENPELPEPIRGETKMVLEEIGRLSTKLNQLLQFSRPAVRGGSVAGNCEARVVVEEVAGVLSHEAEKRGVKLQTKISGNNAKVAATAEALHDILSNLVVNALEATPRGGRVVVAADSNDGECVLAVEDDGPGIPAALQEKILQPFFTTKSQGTGLGLAIVSRRVAESGGKMNCESPVRDGHGTRFRVTLPVEGTKK
jgi:C4-dicarboxylate-specific signal transduction histidine kinase